MDTKTIGRLNEGYNDAEDTSYIFDAIKREAERNREKLYKQNFIKNKNEKYEQISLFGGEIKEELNTLKSTFDLQRINNIDSQEEKIPLFRRLLMPLFKLFDKIEKIEKKSYRTTKEKRILFGGNTVAFIIGITLIELARFILYYGFHYLGIWFPIIIIGSIIIWRYYKNKRTIRGTLEDIRGGIKAIFIFLRNMIKGIGALILGLLILVVVIGVVIYIISGIGLPRFLALLFFA